MEKENTTIEYQWGHGNHFQSEAIKGALPIGQNTPQKCPFGLYAEQVSGSAFTVPRTHNQRSVCSSPFKSLEHPLATLPSTHHPQTPNQLRWSPRPRPTKPANFIQGLELVSYAGEPSTRNGVAIYTFNANEPMNKQFFYNSDGDMLIVPELGGGLMVHTEFGRLCVATGEILVVPRGIKFAIDPLDGNKGENCWFRGYLLEVYNGHFEIPDLGPIGANGLANPQDFAYPCAYFEQAAASRNSGTADSKEPWTLITKFQGSFFEATQDHCPWNVVAWRGNYLPYKYDLSRFCAVNSVTFDHMDPSIFTVLTCKSQVPGQAVVDFVIFPPRWSVAQKTFRPPYYHRNVMMAEYMGLIKGEYEAKKGGGFVCGGGSLHSAATAHGPDAQTFMEASEEALMPVRVAEDTMAFMFETSFGLQCTRQSLETSLLQPNYHKQAWGFLKNNFNSNLKE